MSKLSKTTKDRLRIMAGVIVANYKNFDMRHWAKTNCKSTGCIAGLTFVEFAKEEWDTYADGLTALVNKDVYITDNDEKMAKGCEVRPFAQAMLGLTEVQAVNIFFAGNWPQEFQVPFHDLTTQKAKAKLASEYLLAIAAGKVNLDRYSGAVMISAQ